MINMLTIVSVYHGVFLISPALIDDEIVFLIGDSLIDLDLYS